MNLIRRIVMLGAICVFLVPATATAGDFDRFGAYVGINAAWGYPLFEDQIQKIDPAATVDSTWGLNTRLGLRLLSFLAVEAQYEWMDKFAVSTTFGDTNITGHTLTGNVKLIVPVWRVHPYILAGLGFTRYKVEAGPKLDYFAGRLGGGVDIYLTEKVAINGEVTALLTSSDLRVGTSSLNSLHYLSTSVGLMYRF